VQVVSHIETVAGAEIGRVATVNVASLIECQVEGDLCPFMRILGLREFS
jgi:hypothetical protein